MRSLRLEKGQGLVEYALIIMLVALVVFAALTFFGEGVQSLYQTVVNRFRSV